MNQPFSNKTYRLAVSAFFFSFGFCFASWASRIPYIKDKLHLSEAELGVVLLSLPAGSFISLPISGWLVSRYGSKTIVGICMFLYGFVLIGIGLSETKMQLLSVLFLFGFIGNSGNIAVNTQAVGVERLYKKNIMGSFHGVWSLAGFFGAAFGVLMTNLLFVPAHHFMFVCAVTVILFFIAFKYLLKEDQKPEENVPLFAFPDKSLLILGLIAFCCMLCEGTMFDWTGVYFQKIVQPAPNLVGAGYTAFMCTMALSRFVSDYFTNRFGFKRVVQVSGVIIMSGLMLAVLLPYFIPAVIGFLLVGIGVSSIVPLVYSAAGKSKKLSAGVALAAVSSISFFGFLIGPPIVGLLAGVSSLKLSFAVMAAIGLCISILATWTKKKY